MASNLERRSASERRGATPAKGQRIQPAAVARRSEPLPALHFTKLDKVFTYGIVAMRGSRFAHLGIVFSFPGGFHTPAQVPCLSLQVGPLGIVSPLRSTEPPPPLPSSRATALYAAVGHPPMHKSSQTEVVSTPVHIPPSIDTGPSPLPP
jgi:hypothetical protein